MNSPDEHSKTKFSETKYISTLAVLFVFLVSSISWYVLNRIEMQSRRDIAGTLQTVLATTQEAIDIWADERKKDAASWALSPQLRAAVKAQLVVYHEHKDLNGPVMAEMDEILQSPIMQLGYLGYIVIAPDFTSIASLLKFNMGKTSPLANQNDDFLPRVFRGETLITLPEESDIPLTLAQHPKDNLNMFSATPIRDENNKIIAALVFRFDPSFNFIQIPKQGRAGETAETYFFNKEGLLVSESRFDHQLRKIGLISPDDRGILSIKISDPGGNLMEGYQPSLPRSAQPLTKMAKEATTGKYGIDLDGYRDYRGVHVVGAWDWNRDLDMGLTTEIDYAEAYGSFKTIRLTILALVFGIIFLFCVFTIAYTSAIRKKLSALESLYSKETHMTALVDNIVDAIITIDSKGIIQSFNPAAERLFDYKKEEALGQNVSILMPSPHQENHDEYLQNYHDTGNPKIIGISRDLLARRKNGSLFPMNLSVAKMTFEDSHLFIGIIRDTTDKIINEQRLSLALEIHNGGTWDWDLITSDLLFSPHWLKTYGYNPSDLEPHKSWLNLVHPDDLPMINALVQTHLDGKTTKYSCVYRIRHKSGEWRWSYDQGMVVSWDANGRPLRMVGIDTDITEVKQTEEELINSKNELRKLTRHVLNTQEEERRRICREIHDELGQALTVTKMSLAWITRKINPEQTEILDKIDALSKITDDTIMAMRRIASGLTPQILEDVGLKSAIESHLRQLGIQTGLKCVLTCNVTDEEIGLDRARSLALFRICQEALTNALRHARADSVFISLNKTDSAITLNIEDNGQGIKENMTAVPDCKSLGIIGMKERAISLGGRIEIYGIPGKGTSVTVTLPVNEQSKKQAESLKLDRI